MYNTNIIACVISYHNIHFYIFTIKYRYFSEAVFDIHNCVNVTVSDCYFLNNYGTGIIQEPFRGNTGALAITYYNISTSLDDPTIIVSGCTFTNNSADSMETIQSNKVLSTGIIRGRGGSMGIFINEPNFNIRARVINCSYISSYAREIGGGLYVFASGLGSHNVSIEKTLFSLNRAIRAAGGLIFTGTSSIFSKPHTFYATQCRFESNSAGIGGALFFTSEVRNGRSVAHISQCIFVHNILTDQQDGFGAAFTVINSEKYTNKELFPTHTMSDW